MRKDLRARYKNAALGYDWTSIEPFLLSAVYYALNLTRPHVEGSRILVYFSDNITTWEMAEVNDLELIEAGVTKLGDLVARGHFDGPEKPHE